MPFFELSLTCSEAANWAEVEVEVPEGAGGRAELVMEEELLSEGDDDGTGPDPPVIWNVCECECEWDCMDC